MRKPVTITLRLGGEWFIETAEDWKTALVVASNLLAMQGRLRRGWSLTIEAGAGAATGKQRNDEE